MSDTVLISTIFIPTILFLCGIIGYLAKFYLKMIDKSEENTKQMISVIKDNAHAMNEMHKMVQKVFEFIYNRTL
jgi:hypothetical protein